ncbi:hypothetical protein [Lentzea sp. E54]|uniref:hypothetical protein n=1 Tax=Lentzea xerophila TaxID=3435883 RepID=UPI003DA56D5D
MNHSDQSTENVADGDIGGTLFQAGSIGGDVYWGAPAKPRWRKARWYLGIPAAAAVAGAATMVFELVTPDESVNEKPVAATSSAAAGTTTTSSPYVTTSAQVPATTAGTVRPAPPGLTPRPSSGAPVTPMPPTTMTTVVPVAAPPFTGTGVRFSGELRFGSFHLDRAQPRDVPESNVWALTPTRLHGDPGYWLAEWHSDGVPGREECATHLATRSTQDAENVFVGSRVCGKTPEGRIFRIEVSAMDGSAITGQVTVWE